MLTSPRQKGDRATVQLRILMALAAGTRLGPLEILAPLGVGGMGEVYRARDSRLAREVAIKVLPSEMSRDAEALQRLERQAKSIAALSHPNILAVHQFDVDNAIAFIATELLEGQTLTADLLRRGRDRARDPAGSRAGLRPALRRDVRVPPVYR